MAKYDARDLEALDQMCPLCKVPMFYHRGGHSCQDAIELDEEQTMYDHGVGYGDTPEVHAFWDRYFGWLEGLVWPYVPDRPTLWQRYWEWLWHTFEESYG